MKITSAVLYPLSIPLVEPIKMSGETITDAKTVLLCIRDSRGREGWGEASVAPLMTGETLDSLLASTKYLVEKLRDIKWLEPEDLIKLFSKILYGNTSAKSCFEMALLDLYTQEKEIALWSYLRKRNKLSDSLPVKALPILRMLGGSLEKELSDAKVLRGAGFRHWKIKVGLLPLSEDLERVGQLSEILTDDVVSVDANGAMSLENAILFCQSPKSSRLSFAEQLISPDRRPEDFLELKSHSRVPIGLDESIHGVKEICRWIDLGAFDGASLKLIKTGGLLPALECANLLGTRGLGINLACKVAETSLAGAATASLGFAIPKVSWGFSMSNQYLEFDIAEHALTATHGHLEVSKLNPVGVGIVPNLDRVNHALAKGHSAISF